MISTASKPSGCLPEAGGKREKVHIRTGVNVGSAPRPRPLNPTVLIQGHSHKNAPGTQVGKAHISTPLSLALGCKE